MEVTAKTLDGFLYDFGEAAQLTHYTDEAFVCDGGTASTIERIDDCLKRGVDNLTGKR